MQTSLSSGGYRSKRWELSAPESFVLLQGGGASGREAFKLAIKEAVFRGLVRIHKPERGAGLFGLVKPKPYLTDWKAPPADPCLAALWGVWQKCRAETLPDGRLGLKVVDFARAAKSTFGSLDGYRGRVVLPRLVERGLFRVDNYKVLWIFPAARHVLTAEGVALRAEMDARMKVDLAGVAALASANAGTALGVAGAAGSLLLLTPEILPHVREARRRAAEMADPGWMDTGAVVSDGSHGQLGLGLAEPLLDGADADLGFETDFDFDLDALDSIDDAAADIDAGVSDGDSGGGDSGSGDGAGGGD